MGIDEKGLYNWDLFAKWADSFGVSMEDEDDYGAWWECWKKGFEAGINQSQS